MNDTFRKLMIILALALGFVLMSVGSGLAQTARRIEPAKGGGPAAVKGIGNQAYVFRIAGGDKTVKIKLSSKGGSATFDLLDAAGSDLSEGTDGRTLEMTTGPGEYRLNVTAGKKTGFTLTVTVK